MEPEIADNLTLTEAPDFDKCLLGMSETTARTEKKSRAKKGSGRKRHAARRPPDFMPRGWEMGGMYG